MCAEIAAKLFIIWGEVFGEAFNGSSCSEVIYRNQTTSWKVGNTFFCLCFYSANKISFFFVSISKTNSHIM